MTEQMVETILTLQRIKPAGAGSDILLCTTTVGSLIMIHSMPFGILISGFRGYTDIQKSTWDPDTAQLESRNGLIGLTVITPTTRVTIPLARYVNATTEQQQAVDEFVRQANDTLARDK